MTSALQSDRDPARPSMAAVPHENDYRAVWQCRAETGWLALVHQHLETWLAEKRWVDIDVHAGHVQETSVDGLARLLITNSAGEDQTLVRLELVEQQARSGFWSTEFIAVERPDGAGWLSVTVHNSHGVYAKVPRIVRRLLADLPLTDGDIAPSPRVTVVSSKDVKALVRLLTSPSRQGLVIVAAMGAQDLPVSSWVEQVEKWSTGAVGLAEIVVLDRFGAKDLERLLPGLATPPWSLRTYYPIQDADEPTEAKRHRILGAPSIARLGHHAVVHILGASARTHAYRRSGFGEVARVRRAAQRIRSQELLDASLVQTEAASVASAAPTSAPTKPALSPSEAGPPPAPARPSQPSASTASPSAPPKPIPAPPKPVRPQPPRAQPPREAAPTTRVDGSTVASPTGLEPAAPEQPYTSGTAVHAPTQPGTSHSWLIGLLRRVLGLDIVDEPSLLRIRERLDRYQRLADAAQDQAELIQLYEDEAEEHDEKIKDLQAAVEEYELEAAIDAEERHKLEGQNRWLRQRLEKMRDYDGAYGQDTVDDSAGYPEDFAQLYAEMADLRSEGIILTADEDTLLGLGDIDLHGMCLQTAWEAARTLRDYRRATLQGKATHGLHRYLAEPPAGFYSVGTKKYAASESDTTRAAYGHLRDFKVPKEVDPSGTVRMLAHMKLARIGIVSPRMHFYDDLSRSGKIVIGYIGPHLRTVRTN